MANEKSTWIRVRTPVLILLLTIFVLLVVPDGWLGLPVGESMKQAQSAFGPNGRSYFIWTLALAAMAFGLWKMKGVFIVPLSADSMDLDPASKRDELAIRRIVGFGYSTMVLALLLSFVLFMVPFLWTDSHLSFSQSPIGVLKGCRAAPEDDPLSCDVVNGPQWVLNIGGAVKPRHAQKAQITSASDRLNASGDTQTENDTDAHLAKLKRAAVVLGDTSLTRSRDALPLLKEVIKDAETVKDSQPIVTGAGLAKLKRAAVVLGGTSPTRSTVALPLLKEVIKDAETVKVSQPVVAGEKKGEIEELRQHAESAVSISGGLVLPLFIVVFSLFGGAVSMTRRLPEFQRRVTLAYHDRYAQESASNSALKPPITPEEMREYVVFQIMQTLSAPLIAATVYSLAEPSNQAYIAVIGFASGFASEPILMRLRKLAEQLSGSVQLPSPAMPPSSTGETQGQENVPRREGRLARVRRERLEGARGSDATILIGTRESRDEAPPRKRTGGRLERVTRSSDTIDLRGTRESRDEAPPRQRTGGRLERVRRAQNRTPGQSNSNNDEVMP